MFVPASGITLIFNEFLTSFSLQIFTQDQAQFLTSYTPPLILTNWNSSLFNSILLFSISDYSQQKQKFVEECSINVKFEVHTKSTTYEI